ncbi:hypothetical protein B0H67DRAFT_598909 [Lasiosphaeris hirsuta]|uniref:NAD(P)-binding protein n=1 Tax=Lasiosphaeris hirsuta TaxID=260670 RepID=A0AA40B1C5_9PEZI|nr:hypothetical protein B0H67DRAFT_598909 [Lasiosphaeris hirsuta]
MAQNVNTSQLRTERLFSVEGWVCLVTGGGTGIGLMVYITGRRMEVLEQAAATHSPREGTGQIIPIGPCNVTSKAALEGLYDELATKEPHLNLLICNADIAGPKVFPSSSDATALRAELWEKEDQAGWAAVLNTNVTAVYFTTVAVLPLLQASSKEPGQRLAASVIVISSTSGILRNCQNRFSYKAAKGATVHLTRLMSTEFDKTGVRFNSIAPGYFLSEMTTGASDECGKSEVKDEDVRAKGHPVPAGRAGSDKEMAQACLFLAKCCYVNGEIVAVDGGVSG